MVPKILFLKNSISQLSNAVSTVPIALLDQKLQPEEKKSSFKMYFYFREICKEIEKKLDFWKFYTG